MWSRRQWLAAVACSFAGSGVFANTISKNYRNTNRYLYACGQNRWGENHLYQIDTHVGRVTALQALPQRGHEVLIHPNKHQVVTIGRRPARTFVVNSINGEQSHRVEASNGRHFYGHGVFDAGGSRLYLTENDCERGVGMIGVYDAGNDYRKLREFPSYGIGPHMLAWNRTDQGTLIVANGGIQTHPQTGRKKLNINTMHSSLVTINANNGERIDSLRLPKKYRFNSLRHFRVSKDGDIIIAAQHQQKGSPEALLIEKKLIEKKLIEKKRQSRELNPISLDKATLTACKGYIGDVQLDVSERFIAASSPKGNCLIVVDRRSSQYKRIDLPDVCALAPGDMPNQFIATSGQGGIYRIQVVTEVGALDLRLTTLAHTVGISWDNHASFI